jgi:hypothetical protein
MEGSRSRGEFRTKFESGEYVVVESALRIYMAGDTRFSKYERDVRDTFDWFFFRVGQFQNMIDAKLFTYEDLEVHLHYELDLISGGNSALTGSVQ